VVLFDGMTFVVYEITSVVYDINNNVDGIILPTESDKVTAVGTIAGVQVALTIGKRVLSILSYAKLHA
jgi:hypothetical protein